MLVVFVVTLFSVAKDHLVIGADDSQYQYKYVNTSYGQVKGQLRSFQYGSSYSFLGIPYAAPPVGDLRFKRPRPVAGPWNGTIGDQMPPACIQYSRHPYPWYDGEPGQSEDCLYLNVWTPTSYSDDPLAVLVVIHGGGFAYGSNRMDVYNGTAYGSKLGAQPGERQKYMNGYDGTEGVVVVTINYRLGAFGFLTSGSEDAPGNVGEYCEVHSVQ